jgi:hypothetical protein
MNKLIHKTRKNFLTIINKILKVFNLVVVYKIELQETLNHYDYLRQESNNEWGDCSEVSKTEIKELF